MWLKHKINLVPFTFFIFVDFNISILQEINLSNVFKTIMYKKTFKGNKMEI